MKEEETLELILRPITITEETLRAAPVEFSYLTEFRQQFLLSHGIPFLEKKERKRI
jgi:hypothetical protein